RRKTNEQRATDWRSHVAGAGRRRTRRDEGGRWTMIGILGVLAITALIVILALSAMVKRLLYVSAPNEALVFSGGRYESSDGRSIGYRIIRGGRALRVPLLEKVDSLDLSNIAIDIEVKGAYSKGGIPLNVHGIANVKLPGTA